MCIGKALIINKRKFFVTEEDITEKAELSRKLEELNNRLEHRVVERTAEIESQEERYRSLFEHAPDAIPHKNEWGQEQEMTHNTQEK